MKRETALGRQTKFKVMDFTFLTVTGVAAATIIFITAGILITLLVESRQSLEKFGFFKFIFTAAWNPVTGEFGAFTSLFGTIVTTVLALLMAIPVAIGIAIFITEIAPPSLKGPIGIAIEMLAAIPSIIYGMWGLFTLAPLMATHIEPFLQKVLGPIPLLGILFQGTPLGIDLLTASLILSIMIIPFTASISRDAFELTPSVYKESAYALGATKWETMKDVILPYSKLGVVGGIVLSMGRALGETMAVAFVLGNNHKIATSLLDAAATITVTLANEFAEADNNLYLSSLFQLALVLFLLSFIILFIAKIFLMKVRERTE